MLRKALMLVAVLVAKASSAAPLLSAPAAVEIVSAEFGLFDTSDPGELVFQPGTMVPHKIGQRYGWIIEIRGDNRSLSVREEYLLPLPLNAQKEADSESESLNIPSQRRNQVSQRQLVPVDGKIIGEWAVGSTEPAGHRHLQVVIENQVAASFEFDVK